MFCSNTNGLGSKIDVMNADLTSSHSFGEKHFGHSCCIAMDTKGMVYVSILHNVYSSLHLKGNFLAPLAPRRYVTLCFLILLGFALIPMTYCMLVTLLIIISKAYTTEGQYLGKLCCRERVPDPKLE